MFKDGDDEQRRRRRSRMATMSRGADAMIGFRSARSARDGADGAVHGAGVGVGSDRTERDRPIGRRLTAIVGEIGAAMATPRGGSSGERR
jgi:hypothetical protein